MATAGILTKVKHVPIGRCAMQQENRVSYVLIYLALEGNKNETAHRNYGLGIMGARWQKRWPAAIDDSHNHFARPML